MNGLKEIKAGNGRVIGYEIALSDMSFSHGNIDTLIELLKEIKIRTGSNTFETNYSMGYYDSVEDIRIEVLNNKAKKAKGGRE